MLVAAVLLALLTLYAVAISWFPGPFRDMWIALELIRAGDEGAASWQDYFALHGGAHRLVVPRLLYWIDYHVFAGSNVFLVSVAVLVQVSIVILAARLAARDAAFSRLDRLLLLAMTVLLMFNATQLENFLYTFDVQWFITAAAAAWALAFYNQVFAARARGERVSIIGWLAVGVAAALSIFSSFSGLCLLLLLPVLAMMHRASSRIVIAMAVVMAIGLLAYLSGPFASSSDWASHGMYLNRPNRAAAR